MAEEEYDSIGEMMKAADNTIAMQLKLRKGQKIAHEAIDSLNERFGIEWIQKSGPSLLSKLSGYLKKKYGNLKTRVEMYGEPKTHFEPEYSEVEKREREALKEALKGFEGYNPKDSKKYGVKDRLIDIGAAIAKVKLGYGDTEDKLENYVELDELMAGAGVPDIKGKVAAKSANAAGAEVYINWLHGKHNEQLTEKETAERGKLRKSYGLEAQRDKLLRRRKINELSQYAPEHSGR